MTLVRPGEVEEEAADAHGFTSFLRKVGQCLKDGQNRLVFDALVQAGLETKRAFQIVDDWEGVEEREVVTGWTPELVAAAIIMHDLETTWLGVDWVGLSIELAYSPPA